MRELLTNFAGISAATLTTVAWLPQVVRTVRTRSAADFSWSYLAMFATGVFCWASYGFLRSDLAVLIANLVTIVLVMTIVGIKWRERLR